MQSQQLHIHSMGQGASSKSKGKNIMDKFIKTKGKDKSTSIGVLKATSVGIFEPQNYKKMNNQWEKAKALMFNTDLNKPMQSQGMNLGEAGERLLNAKPPDPERLLSIRDNRLFEPQQKENPSKGSEITGK